MQAIFRQETKFPSTYFSRKNNRVCHVEYQKAKTFMHSGIYAIDDNTVVIDWDGSCETLNISKALPSSIRFSWEYLNRIILTLDSSKETLTDGVNIFKKIE